MLKVRILAGIAGTPYEPGQELTMPAHEAKDLIAQERAELITTEQAAAARKTRAQT